MDSRINIVQVLPVSESGGGDGVGPNLKPQMLVTSLRAALAGPK